MDIAELVFKNMTGTTQATQGTGRKVGTPIWGKKGSEKL